VNRIAMQSIWLQQNLIPFASGFTKRGTIIDTGVDYSHLDMLGMNSQLQIDKSRSATFNRVGNTPAQGAANLNLVSGSVTGHGTHVAGELHDMLNVTTCHWHDYTLPSGVLAHHMRCQCIAACKNPWLAHPKLTRAAAAAAAARHHGWRLGQR
jgi:subtilisin family serine protease